MDPEGEPHVPQSREQNHSHSRGGGGFVRRPPRNHHHHQYAAERFGGNRRWTKRPQEDNNRRVLLDLRDDGNNSAIAQQWDNGTGRDPSNRPQPPDQSTTNPMASTTYSQSNVLEDSQAVNHQRRNPSRPYRGGRGRGGHSGRYVSRENQAPSTSREDHQHPPSQGQSQQQTRGQNKRRPRGRTITNSVYTSASVIDKEVNEEGEESQVQNNLNPTANEEQSEIAECQLKSNDFECMICCDNVRRTNPIWYCSSCYNIFHLKCAIEWCNKSIKSRNEAIANAQYPSLGLATTASNEAPSSHSRATPSAGGYSNYQSERLNSIEWPCPACREVLYNKPDKYKCFCGKVVRPEINKHLTPHSCGQLCGRKRPNVDCPHSCNSICHPGRCLPCPLTCRRQCFCGKLTKEIKCSVGTSSCGEICGKPLECGRHQCSKVCHEGSCGVCEEILTISCNCGQEQVEKRCPDASRPGRKAVDSFTCGKVCGKLLDCGRHYCTEKCHSGPSCPSCKLLNQNIKTCPCGSTNIKQSQLEKRSSCTEPVPTCDNKCNATLLCGPEKNRHKCKKKCHNGSCPPCKLKTPAHCECKQSTKTIDCQLMFERLNDEGQFRQVTYSFTCETRCNKPKNCGRHRCNIKCCKFTNVPGAVVHKCEQMCNRKLACGQHNCQELCHPGQCGDCTNIGWEELTCHCGSAVLYPPIPCGAKRPACRRPCRRPHNCGHPVKHECHDDAEKCAPCIVFVKRSCFCGSDSKDSVYCYLPGYSCGRTCRKQLACKRHTCQRICHDNECETPNERGVILCTQPCPVPRFLCRHPCGLTCHGVAPCPSSECKKTIEISCECGNKVERIDCHKAMRDVENRNKVAMLCTNRSNQDSIMIDLSKKLPPKVGQDGSATLKKLDCDDTCLILRRNKALAEALDIAEPDLKPANIFGEDPLRLLKEAVAQDYKFVAATFNSLAKFIKTAQESDKRFIFMQFAPANKLRREVIHELAHHFNCSSESRDEEPFRHVVVRAYKNKSCVPDFNIEQLLPVND